MVTGIGGRLYSDSGFNLQRFDEHRGWNNENIPWEFTILADKSHIEYELR